MSTHAGLSCSRRIIAATGLALVLPRPGFALDTVPPEALNVKVFPDRYVAAGKPFSDLAALQGWAKPILIRYIWLDGCGSGTTARLLAAVERFQPIYVEGVQIRIFAAGDPACVETAERASSRRDAVAWVTADEGYLATDRYGRSMLP